MGEPIYNRRTGGIMNHRNVLLAATAIALSGAAALSRADGGRHDSARGHQG